MVSNDNRLPIAWHESTHWADSLGFDRKTDRQPFSAAALEFSAGWTAIEAAINDP